MLGAEGGPMLAAGLAAARAELERLARDYGLTVDPDAKIADLSVGEQQRVEILKVLFRGARILILDEPSAVLTPQETDQLFRILRDPEGARRHHRADHPQAARDHGGDRPGLCHAPGPDGGRAPDRRHRPRGAGRADGRPQGAAASRQGGAAARRGARSRPSISAWSMRAACACSTISSSSCAPARSSASRACPATARPSCCRCWPASAARRSGTLTVLRPRRSMPEHPGDPAEMRDLGLAHVPEDRQRQGMVAAFRASETSILGYHERAAVQPQLPAERPGRRRPLRQADGALRRAAARCPACARRISPAATSRSWCWRARWRATQGPAGRPADARRRYRRHRVHPSRAGEEPRRRLRRAGRVGRARRDPVARRPHPGDVRRPDRRRGRRRPRRRAHARPDDGGSDARAA